MKRLSLFLMLAASTVVAGEPTPMPVAATGRLAWITGNDAIQRLHRAQNAERGRVGLPPLALNPDMCLQAQRYAQWMAATGMYRHSSLGYAENIHWQVQQPEHAVRDWANSPGHRANMLGGYRECGFGYDVGPNGARWITIFR